MVPERNRAARFAAVLGAVLLTWATAHCGGHADTTMSTASYARACAADNDCALVFAGDVCSACTCPNAAIAQSAQASYAKEQASRKETCEPSRVSCFCEAAEAFCNQGTCAACNGSNCASRLQDAGGPGFAPRDD
jgi:hypothetical protein